MEKHRFFYELKEALEITRCPICFIIQQTIDRMMENFLYESVSDYQIREKVVHSHGFCNTHAWKLKEHGDPLGHAILYKDLLEQNLNDLKKYSKQPKRHMKIRWFSKETKKKSIYHECLFCRTEKETAAQYLKVLPTFIEQDHQFRIDYEQKGILCSPHLEQLLLLEPSSETVDQILSVQMKHTQIYLDHLNEIIRKSDYRFSNEPQGEEKGGWIRAIGLQSGLTNLRRSSH